MNKPQRWDQLRREVQTSAARKVPMLDEDPMLIELRL